MGPQLICSVNYWILWPLFGLCFCKLGCIYCFLTFLKPFQEMGTAGQAGTGNRFEEQSRLGETLSSLQIILGCSCVSCLHWAQPWWKASLQDGLRVSGWAPAWALVGPPWGLNKRSLPVSAAASTWDLTNPPALSLSISCQEYLYPFPSSTRWSSHTSHQQPHSWLVLVTAK